LEGFSRYRALTPDEQEPGADEGVFRNRLGIKPLERIQAYEQAYLERAYESLFAMDTYTLPVTSLMIKDWHREIFGELYDWAGEWRTVELHLPEDEIFFCPSINIESTMAQYEKKLESYKPTNSLECLSNDLATLHAEFVIIHPFRDGNGRIARFITQYLLLNAGIIGFKWQNVLENREKYHKGIQAAFVKKSYDLLSSLFLSEIS